MLGHGNRSTFLAEVNRIGLSRLCQLKSMTFDEKVLAGYIGACHPNRLVPPAAGSAGRKRT